MKVKELAPRRRFLEVGAYTVLVVGLWCWHWLYPHFGRSLFWTRRHDAGPRSASTAWLPARKLAQLLRRAIRAAADYAPTRTRTRTRVRLRDVQASSPSRATSSMRTCWRCCARLRASRLCTGRGPAMLLTPYTFMYSSIQVLKHSNTRCTPRSNRGPRQVIGLCEGARYVTSGGDVFAPTRAAGFRSCKRSSPARPTSPFPRRGAEKRAAAAASPAAPSARPTLWAGSSNSSW